VITEWECDHRGTTTSMRSIYKNGTLCTHYQAGTFYDGSEGELYDLENDPHQFENRWDEPERAAQKRELIDELEERLPTPREDRLAWRSPV
jgi:hypothetical protein